MNEVGVYRCPCCQTRNLPVVKYVRTGGGNLLFAVLLLGVLAVGGSGPVGLLLADSGPWLWVGLAVLVGLMLAVLWWADKVLRSPRRYCPRCRQPLPG